MTKTLWGFVVVVVVVVPMTVEYCLQLVDRNGRQNLLECMGWSYILMNCPIRNNKRFSFIKYHVLESTSSMSQTEL